MQIVALGSRHGCRGASGRLAGGLMGQAGGGSRWIGAAVAVFLALAVLGYAPWAGAEEPGWEFGLGWGLEDVGSRDQMGSPFAYQGRGFPLVLRVEHNTPGWSVGAEGGAFSYGINGGELRAQRYDGERHWAESVFVDVTLWTQWILARPENHRLSLGVQWSHWTFFRSYHYDPTQIGSVESWDAPLTADLRAELRRSLGRRAQISLRGSLPVIGWMMRPNWAIRGDERIALLDEPQRVVTDGEWMSWHRFAMLRAEAEVQWQMSRRWAMTAQYRFGMFSYRDDVGTQAVTQRGVLGLRYLMW